MELNGGMDYIHFSIFLYFVDFETLIKIHNINRLAEL